MALNLDTQRPGSSTLVLENRSPREPGGLGSGENNPTGHCLLGAAYWVSSPPLPPQTGSSPPEFSSHWREAGALFPWVSFSESVSSYFSLDFFLAMPATCRNSQARDPTQATAVTTVKSLTCCTTRKLPPFRLFDASLH